MFIPLGIASIISFYWGNKYLSMLKSLGKHDHLENFVFLIAFISVAGTLIIHQEYLKKASYDLVGVGGVKQINRHKYEKFFSIRSFAIDREAMREHFTVRAIGEHHDELSFDYYAVVPFDSVENVWMGWTNSKMISYNKYNNKKVHRFVDTSRLVFLAFNPEEIKYFERIPYSDEKEGYFLAIKDAFHDIEISRIVILKPHFEAFNRQHGGLLLWSLGVYLFGALFMLLMIGIPYEKIKPFGLDVYLSKKFKKYKKKKSVDTMPDLYVGQATLILILVNVLFFLILVLLGMNPMAPTSDQLLAWGGMYGPAVREGQYWRLFSYMFVHSGLSHLFGNMFVLFWLGGYVEKSVGKFGYILIYLFIGFIVGLGGLYFHPAVVGVGASGAIAGIAGVLVAYIIFNVVTGKTRKFLLQMIITLAALSLIFGFISNVDNIGHLVGLGSGFIIGLLLLWFNGASIKNRLLF